MIIGDGFVVLSHFPIQYVKGKSIGKYFQKYYLFFLILSDKPVTGLFR